MFLTHFYYKNMKINLESVKDPQPSRVLYIFLSKRLNNYYAPRV
jgi:hypothetical protein